MVVSYDTGNVVTAAITVTSTRGGGGQHRKRGDGGDAGDQEFRFHLRGLSFDCFGGAEAAIGKSDAAFSWHIQMILISSELVSLIKLSVATLPVEAESLSPAGHLMWRFFTE